ncbi:hypothetical protein C8J56DRAFT_884008 [Mycena floridula]|nr:hypothetical protein C8J56DRAFT_884008 [Mycena floridula]
MSVYWEVIMQMDKPLDRTFPLSQQGGNCFITKSEIRSGLKQVDWGLSAPTLRHLNTFREAKSATDVGGILIKPQNTPRPLNLNELKGVCGAASTWEVPGDFRNALQTAQFIVQLAEAANTFDNLLQDRDAVEILAIASDSAPSDQLQNGGLRLIPKIQEKLGLTKKYFGKIRKTNEDENFYGLILSQRNIGKNTMVWTN